MSWLNQLFFMSVICSTAGTVMFGTWYLLRSFFLRIYPKMIYDVLRWTCLLYLLPIEYIPILLHYRRWFQSEADDVLFLTFVKTRSIASGLTVLAVFWFLMSFYQICCWVMERQKWKERLRDSIPIGEEERDIFFQVCKQMGISEGKVELERNVWVEVPLIHGILWPHILIPERDYLPDELKMIFHHELSHYLHKDLWFKQLVILISIIHCWNPFVRFLLEQVDLWSECMADVTALESQGRIHHAKPYYRKIMELMPEDCISGKERYIFSALLEQEDVLGKRISFMKYYQKIVKPNRTLSIFLNSGIVLLTVIVSYLAGKMVADLHSDLYQYTENQEDETLYNSEKEFFCRFEDLEYDHIDTIQHQTSEEKRELQYGFTRYNWNLEPNTRHVLEEVQVEQGAMEVRISISPSSRNAKYLYGMIDENGNVRYMYGRNLSFYDFQNIDQGAYRIFVQNSLGEEAFDAVFTVQCFYREDKN